MSPIGRRATIAAAVAAGTGTWTARATPTPTPTDDQVAFQDDFEDGDFQSNPAWTVYRREGSFRANIVERDTPDGGAHALAVRETMGSGTAGVVGWRTALTGWDAAWTVSGMFYTAAVPLDEEFQGHRVPLAYDPANEDKALVAGLGFRDSEGDVHRFEIDGDLVESVERSHDPEWREDTWYRYEVGHDGDGRYEGRLWTADGSRPSSPDAVSVGRPPGDTPRVGGVLMNGAERLDFEMHHAFMGWRTAADVERRTRTPTPPSDKHPETPTFADQNGPDHDWLDGWYPLVAWLVGVPVLGPLVLAALLAVTDRHGEGPTSADTEEEA